MADKISLAGIARDASRAVALLEGAIAEYAIDKANGVSEKYIVQCDGVSLLFEISGHGRRKVVYKPRVSTARLASEFSKEDAERIAAGVRNGRDTVGVAVKYIDALRKELAAQRDLAERAGAQQD